MAQNPRRFWKPEFGMKVQWGIWLRILSGADVAACVHSKTVDLLQLY